MTHRSMVYLTGLLLLTTVRDGYVFAETNGVQSTTNQSRSMFVTGKAEGFIPADTVFWTLTLTTVDKEIVKGKELNDQRCTELIQLLKQHGVQSADISLGIVRTEESGSGALHTVTVTRNIAVRQTDLSRFSQILEALNAATRLKFNYVLGASKRAEITRATITKAAEAARNKAEAMAGVFGARIKVMSISEYPPPGWKTPDEQVPVDVSASGFGADGEKVTVTLYITLAIE